MLDGLDLFLQMLEVVVAGLHVGESIGLGVCVEGKVPLEKERAAVFSIFSRIIDRIIAPYFP